MRVGIVMPVAVQRGGAELALLHLLRGAAAAAQPTYCIAFLEPGPMVEQAAGLGYDTIIVPAGRLRQPGAFVWTVLQLKSWLVRERLEGALSWMTKAHFYVGPAARMAGLPAVWWQHGLPNRHWMDRLATRLPAAGILACSEAAKAAQLALRPQRAVRLIYPAVDLDEFSAPALRDQTALRHALGLPEDARIVGIVARLQRWKGVHLVLEAVARLREDVPDLFVVVVGGVHPLEPEYADWIKLHADRLGIRDRTVFTGHQTNVPEWMAAMDVVVNASRNEPFGMVIIEAMALGRPVVAVRSGGPVEIIRHNHDGVLVDSNRPEEVARALRRLLCDADLRARLGGMARVRAQDFAMPRLAQGVAGALHELVKR